MVIPGPGMNIVSVMQEKLETTVHNSAAMSPFFKANNTTSQTML